MWSARSQQAPYAMGNVMVISVARVYDGQMHPEIFCYLHPSVSTTRSMFATVRNVLVDTKS